MLADTPTESFVFWTLFLRFCGGLAEREMEFSIVFTVSNAHHTFGDKIGFVMILDTFRASVGEPFGSFGVLLGTFLKCCFLPLLRGTE